MRKLILTDEIFSAIEETVNRTGVETGVRLIGTTEAETYVVKHLIGPGPRCLEEAYTYECDNAYAEDVFNRLLEAEPGLKFLGELHCHPPGYPWLSDTDLRTIRQVLKEYPEFIAGVMQRDPLTLHPIHFPSGEEMEVVCDLYTKSPRARSSKKQAGHRYRTWLRRLRDIRNACAGRRR